MKSQRRPLKTIPTLPFAKLADKPLTLRARIILLVLLGLLLIGLFQGWRQISATNSVVPSDIRKSLNFSVYYPASLPAGYGLEKQSFRLAEPGVVLFAVAYNGKDIVFSEEQQPSAGEMDKFISNYVPLNSLVQLPLGQAKLGAYGNAPDIRTIISLPIHDGPWLIVTAPSDISHDDLVSILKSLTK